MYGDGDGAHLVRVWRSWRSGAPSPPSSWGSGSDSGVGEGEGVEEGGEEEGEEGGDEVVSVGAFADGRDGAEEDELELDLEFRDEEYDQEGDVDEYEGEEGDETLDW